MERGQTASANLMDTHNRLIADVLTRYRTLMLLATIQAEGERSNGNPETIAVAGISMKMEFDGLYASIKELLTLSRKIKELWVFGPLNQSDPHRQAKDDGLNRDVSDVARLLDGFDGNAMRELAESCGGTWEPQAEAALDAATVGGSTTATMTAMAEGSTTSAGR
ncbi:hypothetical protein FZEAL_3310 [Fusarium zealandicum]|uniref:Uncharacterized protein n=1 Tax=Fusarium zealandicum TaxID=1053134 RepID=A0A8H4UPS3_9HYPO|nr:hypothetical protein FZEAL_3310 [Fusarium zealandicum]